MYHVLQEGSRCNEPRLSDHHQKSFIPSSAEIALITMSTSTSHRPKSPRTAKSENDFPLCAVKEHNGSPAVFINGKPTAFFIYSQVPEPDAKHIQQFAKIGVHLYELITKDWKNFGWQGEGKFDFTPFDSTVQRLLEADPEGYFFPRIYVEAPPWWRQAYPEELAAYADGTKDKEDRFGGTSAVSWASEKWLKDAGEAFARLVRHIRRSTYARRCIGFHIGAGIYGEWHRMGSQYLPDVGPRMTEAFRRYLRAKYRNDVQALRRAWNDSQADFETVTCLSQEERLHTDWGVFRDPAKCQRVIDYYDCYYDTQNRAVLHFCKIAKRESEGRALTIIFYGYTSNVYWIQEGGHLKLQPVLNSPYVDIFCSPHTYVGRRPGQDGGFRALPASLRLHGKFFCDESDEITHLSSKDHPHALYPCTREFAVSSIKRQFVNAVTHNVGQWWFDMESRWFDDPVLMDTLERCFKIAQRAMELPRRSVAEMAVLVDLQSVFYTAHWKSPGGWLNDLLLNDQWRELFKSGLPFDLYDIEDIHNPKMPHYKVYLFLNPFYVTPERLETIHSVLSRDEATAIWLWAPGVLSPKGIDLENSCMLTGIDLREEDAKLKPQVRVTEKGSELGIPAGTVFGIDRLLKPCLRVGRKGGTVWGVYADGTPAAAWKSMGKWKSFLCGTPLVQSHILRALSRKAGCHVYSESDDPLYVNSSFIGMHTASEGEKRLVFPFPVTVHDAFSGKEVVHNTREVRLSLPKHETVLFCWQQV